MTPYTYKTSQQTRYEDCSPDGDAQLRKKLQDDAAIDAKLNAKLDQQYAEEDRVREAKKAREEAAAAREVLGQGSEDAAAGAASEVDEGKKTAVAGELVKREDLVAEFKELRKMIKDILERQGELEKKMIEEDVQQEGHESEGEEVTHTDDIFDLYYEVEGLMRNAVQYQNDLRKFLVSLNCRDWED